MCKLKGNCKIEDELIAVLKNCQSVWVGDEPEIGDNVRAVKDISGLQKNEKFQKCYPGLTAGVKYFIWWNDNTGSVVLANDLEQVKRIILGR